MAGENVTLSPSYNARVVQSFNECNVSKDEFAGVNKPAVTALYGAGAGFCTWQGVNFLKSKVDLGRVKSNACHNVNMNVPFNFLKPKEYAVLDMKKIAKLEQLSIDSGDPFYKNQAQNLRQHFKEYNEAVKTNNLNRTQWFKNARHTYAKQALQGAKFRTGLSRGFGGLLIATGTLFAGMAYKVATSGS